MKADSHTDITAEGVNFQKELSRILTECRDNSTPFLLFRYPNFDIKLASRKKESPSSFSFSPFTKGKHLLLNQIECLDIDNLDQYNPFDKINRYNEVNCSSLPIISKNRFIENVSYSKKKIVEGAIKKVVISKPKKITSEIDAIKTFYSLEDKYKSAFVYCFYHPECGLWIGATPEKLLEKDNEGQYHIHSLAGTKGIETEWTEKEKIEQKIVTDYITQKLVENGASDMNVSGPFDYSYGNIKHLMSSIRFKSNNPIHSLVDVIHPTPAVCGMPLDISRQFILDHEGYHRSYYTGHIGLSHFSGINDTFYVNLRCLQIKEKDNAYIYTGAGIVEDSDPESEWEEVEAKAQSLLDCIIING